MEKVNIGFGTTGGTTAHINNFFDSSYDEFISDFGEYGAKTLISAAKDTIKYIKSNILNTVFPANTMNAVLLLSV